MQARGVGKGRGERGLGLFGKNCGELGVGLELAKSEEFVCVPVGNKSYGQEIGTRFDNICFCTIDK